MAKRAIAQTLTLNETLNQTSQNKPIIFIVFGEHLTRNLQKKKTTNSEQLIGFDFSYLFNTNVHSCGLGYNRLFLPMQMGMVN